MRTHPWEVLLLSLALLSTACASLAPTSSRGRGLRDVTCEAQVPAQSAPQARQALLVAVLDVSGSIRRGSAELSRLKRRHSDEQLQGGGPLPPLRRVRRTSPALDGG